MAATPTTTTPPPIPVLPPKVELQLQEICFEKSQPPADFDARKLLSEIGEQESLRILSIICNTSHVKTLSGFIRFLVKKSRSSSPCSPLSAPHQIPLNHSPQARRVCLFASPMIEKRPESQKGDSQCVLEKLNEFEFRKAFLILNYIGRSKLEDVVSADKFQVYQRLSMREFEIEIWNDFGRVNCGEKGRIQIRNWDTGEHHNYHCHVDAHGLLFKGPFLNKAATLLQKTAGDQNVLIVKFMEQEKKSTGTDSFKPPVFNEAYENGIVVGRKCYRFFVFKDGGKEEKKKDPTSSPVKCYFVCMDGFASLLRKPPHLVTVQEARSLFMHIHQVTNLSKYMVRFSLILSKTITLELNYNEVRVEVVEDEPCRDEDGEFIYDRDAKPLILTDGTGFISEDLALKCPHNCYNGCVNNEESVQDLQVSSDAFRFPHNYSEICEFKSLSTVPPLLIQFRMFHEGKAIKGTVLVNKKLPPNTIQVRRSMLKIEQDEKLSHAPAVNSFEVVATSNKPKDAALSKNLIALLHFGGVPKKVFLAMLMEALNKPLAVLYKPKAAIRVAVNCDFTDEYIAARMVASGIPLDEPFLQNRLCEIAKEEMKSLKGGKLPASGCFYLMGTADPTGTLDSNEVCVILDQGQLSGPVLVYRNPGVHPGDIHVVNARYIETLKDYVGNSKYGIFFPSKGQRSMADEIAGGDYDGDLYWVSTNAEFLKYFRPSETWKCASNPNGNKKTNPCHLRRWSFSVHM
ncbi:putative RNA-dependent RNA polymerase 3 [Bienertia sinuspersici]